MKMIRALKTVWKCMFSPRLYKIYADAPLEVVCVQQTPDIMKAIFKIIYVFREYKWTKYGSLIDANACVVRRRAVASKKCRQIMCSKEFYVPQKGEKWGDRIIIPASTMFTMALYASPLICLYVYARGFYTYEECKGMARVFVGFSSLLALSFLMRAYGRATNPKYVEFLKAIERTPKQSTDTYMSNVRKYDFDFSAWPVGYAVPPIQRSSWLPKNPFATTANANLPFYQRTVIQLLAFIATHTFALRLIYPGSLSIIHQLLWQPILQGRSSLVEEHFGKRTKVKTADGNFIDTMFVDKRSSSPYGSILVVCCEGNSGFYEVGIMNGPIKGGYSALGWNHPGFAGSTGLPYPDQEHNAIDAVMQYAINELNFKPDQIVLFGWSIGGYSAAWGSINYNVKGVVLDATFDDILPLAENQMPMSWSLLVKEVIRSYANLHVSEVLKEYTGPIHLVRRTDDEIICLRPGQPSTNRANYLLIDIIKQRHASFVNDHLSKAFRYACMLASSRPFASTEEERRLLDYVKQYMRDVKATHCSPLPDSEFAAIMSHMFDKRR